VLNVAFYRMGHKNNIKLQYRIMAGLLAIGLSGRPIIKLTLLMCVYVFFLCF